VNNTHWEYFRSPTVRRGGWVTDEKGGKMVKDRIMKYFMIIAIVVIVIMVICALKNPAGKYWDRIGTVVVTLTLLAVIWYTIETAALAKATSKMAALQEEEIGLKKRPIVSWRCHDHEKFYFTTEVANLSSVHAKCRVKATIEINAGRDGEYTNLALTKNHHYNGKRIWQLQAGVTTFGHLDFRGVLALNKVAELSPAKARIRVRIESWVINYREDEQLLLNDNQKNPPAQWDWNGSTWVVEVVP
jgi:hypothetical protein